MTGMGPAGGWSWLLAVPLIGAALGYLSAVIAVGRRGRWWPAGRTMCWLGGLVAATVAVCGPLAAAAHHHFTAHMAGHLLLGMAAPLLLVYGAPITLALRALPVDRARRLSRILGTRPVRVLAHPVTGAALNGGGLWLLYTTGLYSAMMAHPWLHIAVQAHILAAGYLFTSAVLNVDPAPHRPSRQTRGAVLIAFLAAHGILAKYLHGHAPAGVSGDDAQAGAQLMYYGGDLIDLVIIVAFCHQWYTALDRVGSQRRA